ncbi:hypothetical protein ED733_001757 [Metarhizium rileyi]|uniref:Uncharacterized protein n=1 Tax=Metarhizium rileyi (strain RCEF 4871) TaxID=1649241 RepID=A0A5C6G3Y1_METRR|nr:hypothetical protein ED733_001757 [Metarhizium rileyi]
MKLSSLALSALAISPVLALPAMKWGSPPAPDIVFARRYKETPGLQEAQGHDHYIPKFRETARKAQLA